MPHKRLIALDFDGVLHSYTSPWTDAATIADGPTPGAIEFIYDLVDDGRFDVVVVSSRLAEDAGVRAVKNWLDAHLSNELGDEIGGDVMQHISFSKIRPPAFLTLDDRAVTFQGVWPDLNAIAEFRPWNKRPKAEAVGRVLDDGRDPNEYELDRDRFRLVLGSVGCRIEVLFAVRDVERPRRISVDDWHPDLASRVEAIGGLPLPTASTDPVLGRYAAESGVGDDWALFVAIGEPYDRGWHLVGGRSGL